MMTPQDLDSLEAYLVRAVDHAGNQAEDRALGVFGQERNTPEQISFWRGVQSGYRAALEELRIRREACNTK